MRNIVLGVVIIAELLWISSYCTAKTIYVDVNGPNAPGQGSYEDPFQKIQDAIDSLDNYDMVIVAQGRYFENIRIDANNIVLTSTDPSNAEVVSKTIIDGNAAGSAVTFDGPCRRTVLTGFTITNGYAQYGGGIYCLQNSRPKITNCMVLGNTVTAYGGGIYSFNGSDPMISGCIIVDNSAAYGGGIACVLAGSAIDNSAIINNSANYGSALASVAGHLIVSSCTITNNTANNDGSTQPGNFNRDELVDFIDFTYLAKNWRTSSQPANFNQDEIVNFKDFVVLGNHWMSCLCSEPNWCNDSDLDKSGCTDVTDLKIFMKNWLW